MHGNGAEAAPHYGADGGITNRGGVDDDGTTNVNTEKNLSGKPGQTSSSKPGADGGELNEHAFDHPAAYDNLKPVWVPKDSFGLGDSAIRDLRSNGIDATDAGAEMNDKGSVTITRQVAALPSGVSPQADRLLCAQESSG